MSRNHFIGVSLMMTLVISTLITTISAAPMINPIDPSKSAQGLFATYFENIINTPCAIGSVISGFSSSSDEYGKKICVSMTGTLINMYPTLFDVTWLKSGANISYTGGNVGIGTTVPGVPLELSSTSDAILRLRQQGGGWNYMEFHNDTIRTAYFGMDISNNLSINGQLMVNTISNNVGIGTLSPLYKLEVNGKIGSHTTLPADNDNTVTTKNYVDARLASLCTSLGGTWNNATGICTPAITYSWQLGTTYGSCDASCGGGTQTAPTVCKQSNGSIVADSLCAGVKPGNISQSCNTQACPVNCSYTTTGLSACSVSCGGGTQTDYYRVTAAAQNGGTCAVTDWQVAATQACNTQACVSYVYNWRTGGYGGIEALWLIGHPTWRPNISFWCSREIVGNTWNDGNVGVADSFCSTKPVERCSWTAWPDNNVVIDECH